PLRVPRRAEARGYNPITFITASFFGSTTTGSEPAALIALSGSFKPWPVMVAVITLPSGIVFDRAHLIKPASGAHDAGSAKIPSDRATSLYAARISSSVTLPMWPLDSLLALSAPCQLAGLPIRIAEATVLGSSIG